MMNRFSVELKGGRAWHFSCANESDRDDWCAKLKLLCKFSKIYPLFKVCLKCITESRVLFIASFCQCAYFVTGCVYCCVCYIVIFFFAVG